MGMKEIPYALVSSVMSLYKGTRTNVNDGTHLSNELEVNAGVHNGSVLSSLLFVNVIDVVRNKIKEGMPQEILHAYNCGFDSGENGGTAVKVLELKKCACEKKCDSESGENNGYDEYDLADRHITI